MAVRRRVPFAQQNPDAMVGGMPDSSMSDDMPGVGVPDMPDPGADMYFDPNSGEWRYRVPTPNPADAIMGNTTGPMGLFGGGASLTPRGGVPGMAPPSPVAQQQQQPGPPPLPRGLSVQSAPSDLIGASAGGVAQMPGAPDDMSALMASLGLGGDGDADDDSADADQGMPGELSPPMSDNEPAPAAARGGAPSRAPISVSSAPSLLFPETRSGGLMGSGGGLFGGGRNIAGRQGAGEGGTSALFMQILRLLKDQLG